MVGALCGLAVAAASGASAHTPASSARASSPSSAAHATAIRPRPRAAALLSTASATATLAPSATLTLGLTDGVFYSAPAVRTTWIAKTRASGAGLVLLSVDWASVAPADPTSSFHAGDAADPQYDWQTIDAAVRALSAAGLTVAIDITDAPTWAQGPHPPASAPPGTWRPNAAQFARFAGAAARRYSGTFPDPLEPGQKLPRVRYWQAWAEPNLNVHLMPQWTRVRGRYVPASPAIYRTMLNAFYAAVTGVQSSDVVITAGTAPYGDPPGGLRMQPAMFARQLLCLSNSLTALPCPDPAHFDILAHDPYEVASPLTKALNPDDVSAPDLGKLTRPLLASERLGLVQPPGPKRLWVTEFSYDTDPPDPQGVPIQRQARWLEQAMYVFWRQGVDAVVWYLVRDQPPIPNYASSYQSGLYYIGGAPKPALQAFIFPFVVSAGNGGALTAWGRAPAAGVVSIEQFTGGSWHAIARVSAGAAGDVFQRALAAHAPASFRAVQGTRVSLVWTE